MANTSDGKYDCIKSCILIKCHIGVCFCINGAREQRAAREFFFNHAISKMEEPHGEIDKDLTVFLKDDETAHVSNVELLTAFASKDGEKIRPYLEKMMI